MPGMTGLDLVAEMQTSLKNVPVIFVSAYKRAEFIQRALRLNAVDYLDKPVDPTELDNALKKVFENKPYIVLASGSNNSKRFFLLTDIDERFVESDEILCFQSSKRYSIAYFTDNTNRIIRSNLTNLSGKIPKDCFLQISRQFIVNLKYVKCISKSLKEITLKGGIAELKVQKVFPQILNVLIMNNRIKN